MVYKRVSDRKPTGNVIHVSTETSTYGQGGIIHVPIEEEGQDMAKVTSRRQLDIWECHTEDGGVGLKFGDGPLFMGYDARDLRNLLEAIFIDNGNCQDPRDADPADGDLLEIAEQYLDPERAEERRRYLRDMDRHMRGEW